MHILYIFAEVVNDSVHDYNAHDSAWLPGQLPGNFDEVIDYEFTGRENIKGFMTRYFYQASFGKYIVLGDYVDTLIQINMDTLSGESVNGLDQCLAFLNRLGDNNLATKHGYRINSNFFDRIINNTGSRSVYFDHPILPDGRIDLTIILWRTNSNITKIDDSGYGTFTISYSVKGKITGHLLNYRSSANKPFATRHEFSHKLVGGNQFHSGGSGAGTSYFLSDISGYSLLSSHNRNSEFCNGWDRWWLGWKDTSKKYFISAVNQSGQEINTDLGYNEYPSTGDSIIILRDFYDYGDAIRIELPYLDSLCSTVKKQYLWIENHYNVDYYEKDKFQPGVYMNLQIGNDDTANFSSRTNFIYPLCGFGNYDFNYSYYNKTGKDEYYNLETDTTLSNPFTGYHYLMKPSYDLVSNNTPDTIYTQEWIEWIKTIKWNGQVLHDSIFRYPPAPYLGTIYDGFKEGRVLSLSTNPAPVPVMTYGTKDKRYNSVPFFKPDSAYDNRYIFLNGLYIEIQEIEEDGDARIKIGYDHYNVENNVRWTGNIVLFEKLILDANKTITLDQGLTPTKPVNPIQFNDRKIFADPSIFMCKKGSYFEVNDDAELMVKNHSTFSLESGSALNINGDGKVTVGAGSNIQAETGIFITLKDSTSTINLDPGSNADLCNATFNGNGTINNTPVNINLQDQVLTGIATYSAWNKIECNQNVTINADADIKFKAKDEILIKGGFRTEPNASLEIYLTCPD